MSSAPNQQVRLELAPEELETTGPLSLITPREQPAGLDDAISLAVSSNRHGAYCIIDVDSMALFRDTFGETAGDAVITEIRRRIEFETAAFGAICRVNGAQIDLILPDCTAMDGQLIAERLIAAVSSDAVSTGHGSFWITVSVGMVLFPHRAASAREAMLRAQWALDEARRRGGDCCVSYDVSDAERNRRRQDMVAGDRILRALQAGRLIFAYQPVVAAHSETVEYYECLARIIDRDGSLLSASDFVPVAERLGLIRLIDQYVLEKVVEQLAQNPGVTLGINVSALTLGNRTWLETLRRSFSRRPDMARRLLIEITETAAQHDVAEVVELVSLLHDLGCRVALDDFGAGHTSLMQLHRLPVDLVKIDAAFIRNIDERPDKRRYLEHLVGLARELGFATVGEGVETPRQAAILREQGVTFLQGYFFGTATHARPWAVA